MFVTWWSVSSKEIKSQLKIGKPILFKWGMKHRAAAHKKRGPELICGYHHETFKMNQKNMAESLYHSKQILGKVMTNKGGLGSIPQPYPWFLTFHFSLVERWLNLLLAPILKQAQWLLYQAFVLKCAKCNIKIKKYTSKYGSNVWAE